MRARATTAPAQDDEQPQATNGSTHYANGANGIAHIHNGYANGDSKIGIDTRNGLVGKSARVPSKSNGDKESTKVEENVEFGGPFGVACIILWSHYILLYFWYCLETNNGYLVIPTSYDYFLDHSRSFVALIGKHCPSLTTVTAYVLFFALQLLLAAFVPGVIVYGLPTAPHGVRLKYFCNGYLCYYFCIAGVVVIDQLHENYEIGIPITHLCDHFGQYLLTSIMIGDMTSLYWYLYGIMTNRKRVGSVRQNVADKASRTNGYCGIGGSDCHTTSRSGNVIYDFFMGTCLYPRIGIIDIKMVSECRWSWLSLMLLTTSCAVRQFRDNGYISLQMAFMVLAHWLYSNATVKGEQYIPATWDMFHEKYGWMLNFWNITGVPFLYCFQTYFILKNQERISNSFPHNIVFRVPKIDAGDSDISIPVFSTFLFVFLLAAYYIFDTANQQKAAVKISKKTDSSYVDLNSRNCFPSFQWGVLKEPITLIRTPKGDLLIDGWYAFARKAQYTGDLLMAISWGLATGLLSSMNYFYAIFFFSMITHRQIRDERRCQLKYGRYWKLYTKLVPNVFLPSSEFFVWFAGGKHPFKDTDKIKETMKELQLT